MKHLFIIVFLFSAHLSSVAQKRYIKSEGSETVVPFATIKVLHTTKGEIANSDGSFELVIEPSDTLLISSAGYLQKTVLGKNVRNVIYLQPKAVTLQEVVVKEKKWLRTVVLGNGAADMNSKINCNFNDAFNDDHCINWGPANLKEEFAERMVLPDSALSYQIKKLYIPIRKFRSLGPLLVRIYLVDESTGLPGEEIFATTVAVSKANLYKEKVVVDLQKDNIVFTNEKAFFVGVGWPPGFTTSQGISSIVLKKQQFRNTYHRSLVSKDFRWYLFGIWKPIRTNLELTMNTQYAVVLNELR